MTVNHKVAALDELVAEREHVALLVEKLGRQRDDLMDQLAQLDGEIAPSADRLRQLDLVIAPLTALVSVIGAPLVSVTNGTPTMESAARAEDKADPASASDVDEDWEIPDVFKRYLPKSGGDGKRKRRLRSTLMVSDIVDKLGEPVTRDRLREAFYDHFGREDIKRFWDRPDNALTTAIIRARDEDLIIEVPADNNGPALYMAHFRESETGQPAMPANYLEEGN